MAKTNLIEKRSSEIEEELVKNSNSKASECFCGSPKRLVRRIRNKISDKDAAGLTGFIFFFAVAGMIFFSIMINKMIKNSTSDKHIIGNMFGVTAGICACFFIAVAACISCGARWFSDYKSAWPDALTPSCCLTSVSQVDKLNETEIKGSEKKCC